MDPLQGKRPATWEATKPEDAEASVTLLGPGTGESAIVHVGWDNWIVIDSCVADRNVLPLRYLASIGVSYDRVRLVVATHFDIDHVRGLSTLMDACPDARLAIASVFGAEPGARALRQQAKVGPRDFRVTAAARECHDALLAAKRHRDERGGPGVRPAHAIVTLQRLALGGSVDLLVEAWSPSDGLVQDAIEVALSTDDPQSLSRVPRNLTSVVVWIRVGDRRMLFGADLERHDRWGWAAVVALGEERDCGEAGRAQALKVPHHGSADADDDALWDHLVAEDAIAIVAPWRRGGRWLPHAAQMGSMAARAREAWCTIDPDADADTSPEHGDAAPGTTAWVTARCNIVGPPEWSVLSGPVARKWTAVEA